MTKHIIIIGAGIGGLSAAIRLAAAGVRVTVLEQNSIVGGKMYQHRADGFYWDTGPSIVTMRHVFEELFAAAGRRLDDYVTLRPVEPLTRYFWEDGTVLDTTRDLSRMVQQIAQIDERDVEGYLNFLSYAARVHRITGPVFIYDDPPSWRGFLKTAPLDLPRIDPVSTLYGLIRRNVRSRHLRQLLSRYATYVGASPYQAPAMLSVIAHVELSGGVWYPEGGIHALADAMLRLARELGVNVQTGQTVEQILVLNGSATGVRLQNHEESREENDTENDTKNGTEISADAVIANVDVATVYQHLLPQGIAPPGRIERLTQTETSCSGFVLLLGIKGDYAQLLQHNIFFCRDYRQEFTDIFTHGRPPREPTVYVSITSKEDAEHAPPGCENWFVLVNAPPAGGAWDWEREATAYRNVVLEQLSRFGLDVRDKIRSERIMTPLDIAKISGAWRGALYGISSNSPLNAFRRPHNRCPDLKALYFAGGTTHPGGGVPMVTLSGKVAARMVLKDLRRER